MVLLPLAALTVVAAAVLIFFAWIMTNKAALDAAGRSVGEIINQEVRVNITQENFLRLQQDPRPFEEIAGRLSSPSLLGIKFWNPSRVLMFPQDSPEREPMRPQAFNKAQSGEVVTVRHDSQAVLIYVPISFLRVTASPDGIVEVRYSSKILSEDALDTFRSLSFFIVWVLFLLLFAVAVLMRIFIIEPVERLRREIHAYMKKL